MINSESVSIPKNPRTDRPVGYAFVDLSTPTEAERAISELSGKEILERKVSVQLARKPEPAGEKTEGSNGDAAADGTRRRASGRGRGRGRGGRGSRNGRVNAACPSMSTLDANTMFRTPRRRAPLPLRLLPHPLPLPPPPHPKLPPPRPPLRFNH